MRHCRYEVLQFCWLAPEQRATAEEVHRLLVYLRMQGQKDMEEDFEQRWDALKPNPSGRQNTIGHTSFPILEQFADDAMRQEADEVLTVTETSKGLSFEYVWEAAKHDHYDGSHGRSGVDTTLNYHSMFFPVSSEDIQAHFPDPEVHRTAGKDGLSTPSGIPGVVQVFDAQKPSEFRDYYIQLEEQGESVVEEDGNRRDLLLDRQDFVHLQDVRLDESSTEADFFHQSIDSKDSYLPDSHIWSSLENDSPYHTTIFTDGGSKQEDSPSWRSSFMEFSERNGESFHKDGRVQDVDTSYGGSFLGKDSEAPHLVDSLTWKEETTDMKRLLNADKLTENFMFLKNQSLMKDRATLSSPQENFLSPGVAHEPEDAFRMGSWDNLNTLSSFSPADSYLQPSASSTSARPERSDSPSAGLGAFQPSAAENETLVPFITVDTEEDGSVPLPVAHSPSSEDLGPAHSSDRGTDSGFDSTSERFEIVICQDGHADVLSESAPPDLPRPHPDLSGLADDLQPGANKMPETPSPDEGHSEDLTSNILVSELTEDADLSDQEEALMDATGRSSLLVSGPSLDQISQDSLLEDSMSTHLAIVDASVETPDSFDSLDIHRLGEQAEELSVPAVPHKLQPPYKISDSGYETENLESPEWNSQLNLRDHSPVKNCSSLAKTEEPEDPAANANVVPPEIVISKAEGVVSSHGELVQPDVPAPPQEPLVGGHYRDSAYFSDNESEPEKKPEETVAGGSAEAGWMRSSDDPSIGGAAGGGGGGDHVEEELDPFIFGKESLAAAEPQPEPEQLVGERLVEVDFPEKEPPESTPPQEEESLMDLDLLPAAPPPSRPPLEQASHPKLTRTQARKEPDMEGRFLARREDPGSEAHEDGMDADEEDENSEDSEDELHAYQLHSSSSDSEDESAHAVPVIVSDDSGAKNLRSLLKPSTLNVDAWSPEGPARSGGGDGSRKAVSFFDDVTVFLFDQVKSLWK